MRTFPLSTLLIIFLFAFPGYVFSQTKTKISGTVSDSSKPLPLVTVRLLKTNNTPPLETTLSKDDGSFQLNQPGEGSYVLSFTHTGFEEKKITIAVGPQPGDMKIEPVQLARLAEVLKEVTVTSQRPMIEQSDDKIVFNVGDDPTAKSETAIEILRRTPFVTVDGDDNIKVNGKSNFKVLLNGRETS